MCDEGSGLCNGTAEAGQIQKLGMYFSLIFGGWMQVQNFHILSGVTNGVRCFCTEDHCTYGTVQWCRREREGLNCCRLFPVCESPWCLVGIKESGPVIRTCGNEAARMLQICRRRVGEWLEVCACDTPYCNTFAFLRHQIKHNRFAPSAVQPPAGGTHDSQPADADEFATQVRGGTVEGVGREGRGGQVALWQVFNSAAGGEDPDTIAFTINKAPPPRQRRPPDTNFEVAQDDSSIADTQDSYLIIVLIIVPLTVGAVAVLLVSLNYYCSLC